MRWILLEQDLWEHASGEAIKPEPDDTHKVTNSEKRAIADWMKKDQQAFAAISLCISDDYLVYTYGASTACGVWLALLTIFEARGLLGIINMHQDFFCTFVAEGGNMEEHIRKLHSLQKQLHVLGDLIKDRDFCNVLLTSLCRGSIKNKAIFFFNWPPYFFIFSHCLQFQKTQKQEKSRITT